MTFRLPAFICLALLCCPTVTFAQQTGYSGRVSERDANDAIGQSIANAHLVFVREDGKYRRAVRSDKNGQYRIALPAARYKVTVKADGFADYDTGSGFVVVTGDGLQASNFFLRKLGTVDALVARDLPPAVVIKLSSESIKLGEEVTVTLMALDDRGLATMWWFEEAGLDPELDKAHQHDCQSEQFAKHTWTIRPAKAGEYIIGANARDTAYGKAKGKPHQASEGAGIPRVKLVVQP